MPAGPTEPTHCETIRRLSSGAPASCTAVEYCTHSPTATGWMLNTWISAMNRFGENHHVRSPSMSSRSASSPWRRPHRPPRSRAPAIRRTEPAHGLGELCETPAVESFSLCPPPRSRVTAVDGVAVEGDRSCCRSPRKSIRARIGGDSHRFRSLPTASSWLLVWCCSQPAVSSTLPSGDSRTSRSISPAAAPRCSSRVGPSGAKLPNTNPWCGIHPRHPAHRQVEFASDHNP